MNVAAERSSIVAQIRMRGKKDGDPQVQKYLGSPHPVLGLPVPQMRAIVTAFRKEHRDATAKEVAALAVGLWRGRTFEEKALAVLLLDTYAKALDETSWRLLNSWVDECVGWGMCDAIGSGPIAKMVHARPERFRELLRWARSPNPWRRRISLYALRDFVYAKDLDKPFTLIRTLLYDEEFWVRRAVGTWLRECWKRDRQRTESFLRTHVRGLPSLVITVATERSPKVFRDELRRAAKVPRTVAGPPN